MKKGYLYLSLVIVALIVGFITFTIFNSISQKTLTIQNTSEIKNAFTTTPTPNNSPTIIISSKVIPYSTSLPTQKPTEPPIVNTPIPNNIQPLYTPTPIPDSTSPTIKIGGPGDGSTVTNNKFCYLVEVFDNATNLVSRNRLDSGVWTEWGRTSAQYNPCFENMSDGSHTFTVEAQDPTGNTSTQSRSVIVNTSASATINPIQAN